MYCCQSKALLFESYSSIAIFILLIQKDLRNRKLLDLMITTPLHFQICKWEGDEKGATSWECPFAIPHYQSTFLDTQAASNRNMTWSTLRGALTLN